MHAYRTPAFEPNAQRLKERTTRLAVMRPPGFSVYSPGYSPTYLHVIRMPSSCIVWHWVGISHCVWSRGGSIEFHRGNWRRPPFECRQPTTTPFRSKLTTQPF